MLDMVNGTVLALEKVLREAQNKSNSWLLFANLAPRANEQWVSPRLSSLIVGADQGLITRQNHNSESYSKACFLQTFLSEIIWIAYDSPRRFGPVD